MGDVQTKNQSPSPPTPPPPLSPPGDPRRACDQVIKQRPASPWPKACDMPITRYMEMTKTNQRCPCVRNLLRGREKMLISWVVGMPRRDQAGPPLWGGPL